jgi:predicted nucleic acid-binding protein
LVDPDIDHAYRLARRIGLSVYRAAYVALGEAAGATLWTGDRRLAELAKSPSVRWIGEYESGR